METKVGVSNRHVHLCKEDLEILFGKDYVLSIKNALTQKDEFSCNETVTVKTEKSEINSVRIIGPIRSYTQVEISKTDSYKLGIDPPVNESGNLENASPITIIGPKNEITKKCAIISQRHLHISPEQRKNLFLTNVETVDIEVTTLKPGVMKKVSIKENPSYTLELHIDTDDANAFLLKNGSSVEIILH